MADENESVEEEEQESVADSIKAAMEEANTPADEVDDTEQADEADKAEDLEAAKEAESEEEAENDDQEQEAKADEAEAPAHWKPEERELFAKLDDTGKQAVLNMSKRLEASYTDKFESLADDKRRLGRLEQINDVFEPYREELSLQGIDEVQATRTLLAAHRMLQQRPAEAIKYFATQYGVDLNTLNDQPDDMPSDPRVAQLEQGIQTLNQQIGTMSLTQAEQQVERFWQSVEGKFRDELETDMAEMATQARRAGKTPDLNEIYERAKWSNPEVREKVLAEQRSAETAKAEAERKQKAKEARRTGTAVDASPTTGMSEDVDPNDLKGLLKTAYAEASES